MKTSVKVPLKDTGVTAKRVANEIWHDRKKPHDSTETNEDSSVAMLEPAKEEDALYVMENPLLPGIVKIGRSSDPEERARQMSTSHPFRLRVQRA